MRYLFLQPLSELLVGTLQAVAVCVCVFMSGACCACRVACCVFLLASCFLVPLAPFVHAPLPPCLPTGLEVHASAEGDEADAPAQDNQILQVPNQLLEKKCVCLFVVRGEVAERG